MSPNPGPAMHPNLSWRQSPNDRDPIWPARLLIGLVLTILLAGRAFAAEARTFKILHIHADDHRPDGLHALGTKELVTPHLDALVARGSRAAHQRGNAGGRAIDRAIPGTEYPPRVRPSPIRRRRRGRTGMRINSSSYGEWGAATSVKSSTCVRDPLLRRTMPLFHSVCT